MQTPFITDQGGLRAIRSPVHFDECCRQGTFGLQGLARGLHVFHDTRRIPRKLPGLRQHHPRYQRGGDPVHEGVRVQVRPSKRAQLLIQLQTLEAFLKPHASHFSHFYRWPPLLDAFVQLEHDII